MRPGSDHRRGGGSGATQLEEFFEKPSRGDEPEPPIGHPPRFHRFDPWLTGAAALRRRLAQGLRHVRMICFTTGRENAGGDGLFVDSDLQAPAASQ